MVKKIEFKLEHIVAALAVISIFLCMMYPLGYSYTLTNSTNSSEGLCKICCDLNHWASEHNLTADICANVTGGGGGSGDGNDTDDDDTNYTCAMNTIAGVCGGTCPSGQTCQETNTLWIGGECACAPYSPPGSGDEDGNDTPAYNCTDSDGGQDAVTWGYCQSDYTHTGMSDSCRNGTYVDEQYCDDTGRCAVATIHCAKDNCDSPGFCN